MKFILLQNRGISKLPRIPIFAYISTQGSSKLQH